MKILKFIILFALTIVITEIYAQTYNELITKAYSAIYVENDYKKANDFFAKAFKIKKNPISTDLYYASQNCSKTDNLDLSVTYLLYSLENGYSNYENISNLKKQEYFKDFFSEAIWDSVIALSKKNYIIYKRDFETQISKLNNHYELCDKVTGRIDLRNDSLPVKHQGRRNTCSVFAATALIEKIIYRKYNEVIDLSESYNYWAAKSYALTNNYLKETYTSIDGLAGYLAVEAYKYGSMLEKDWPYEKTNWLSDKNSKCKKINNNHIKECFTGVPPENSNKAIYTAQPIDINREDIGQFILQEKKPVAMNIFWYYDAVDSVGNIKIPTDKTSKKGGHVILLVGYNSKTKTFIFQNSWGKKWGSNGYGTIPEEYIINYFEVSEAFPYGTDSPQDVKTEAIKASMGVSANITKIEKSEIKHYPYSLEQINKIILKTNVLQSQKEYKKALKLLQNTEQWAFDDYNVLVGIASIYKQKKDYDNAIKYYNKIIEFCSNDKKEIAKQLIKGIKVK